MKLWHVSDGALVKSFDAPTSSIAYSVAISPDGTTVAAGDQDQTVHLWSIATGSLVKTISGHTGAVFAIAFAPSGQLLASASGDKTVKLPESPERIARTHPHRTYQLCRRGGFLPDGAHARLGKLGPHGAPLASLERRPDHDAERSHRSGARSRIHWEWARRHSELRQHGAAVAHERRPRDPNIQRCHSSVPELGRPDPAGLNLFVGSLDGHARGGASPIGALLATLGFHTGAVTGVGFSADESLLASSSQDTTAKCGKRRAARSSARSRGTPTS